MNFPVLPNGHLYQYATVLSVFVTVASFWGMVNAVGGYDVKIHDVMTRVAFSKDATEEEKKWWIGYLNSHKRNAETLMQYSTIGVLVGVGLAVLAMYFWYFRVQQHEDRQRLLVNQKTEREMPPEGNGRKVIVTDGS